MMIIYEQTKTRVLVSFTLSLSLLSFVHVCSCSPFSISFSFSVFSAVFLLFHIYYIIIKKGRGVCVCAWDGMGWDDGFSFLVGTLISMLCLCYFNI